MFGLEGLFGISILIGGFIKEKFDNRKSLKKSQSVNYNNRIEVISPHTVIDKERYERDLEMFGYELTEKLRKAGNYNYKNNV